jgi:chromate transporter
VIYILSLFFSNILEIAVVANAFKGIKIAVGVLIVNVGLKMLGTMHKMKRPIIIMSCSLILSLAIHFFKWSFSSIYIILIAGLTGFLIFIVSQRTGADGGAGK